MAMTAAAVTKPTGTRPYSSMSIFDVTATADGDTGNLVIAHGLGVIPEKVDLEPILAAGPLSNWSETPASRSITNITLVKNATATGSGNASAQLRVYIQKPHTMTR